jgi:hypothetical protein
MSTGEQRGHWYRSYEDMSLDPKFKVVARRAATSVAGVRVSDAIAVWVNLLERASQASERGTIEGFDGESIDALLDMPEGAACALVDAFREKGMIESGAIAKWEKRQPQRERPNDLSTERTKRFKEKQRQGTPGERQGTPGNTLEQNRTEKNREENTPPNPDALPPARKQESFQELSGGVSFSEIPEDQAMPIEFQELVSAYPEHRRDVIPAFKAFAALRHTKGFMLQALFADLVTRCECEQWTKEGGKYAPKLSRYIGEQMWRNPTASSREPPSPIINRAKELDALRAQMGEKVRMRT